MRASHPLGVQLYVLDWLWRGEQGHLLDDVHPVVGVDRLVKLAIV